MIENFLEIHSKEDVSNAIALFLNRDITEYKFGSFTWTVTTSEQHSDKFDDVDITIECWFISKDDGLKKSMFIATMPYVNYRMIIRDKVSSEIEEFEKKENGLIVDVNPNIF